MMFYLEVRPRSEDESDPGFERKGPYSNEDVVAVDAMKNRNLNHERYYTRIVSAEHGTSWRSEAGLRAERKVLSE